MTARNENQSNARRALRALFALQGNAFEGVRLKEVATALDTSSSNALRTLEVMQDEGIVERIPGRDEFWRLSPRVIQLARAHEQEMARLRERMAEIEQRYSRTPD